jgi:hypothetical protein
LKDVCASRRRGSLQKPAAPVAPFLLISGPWESSVLEHKRNSITRDRTTLKNVITLGESVGFMERVWLRAIGSMRKYFPDHK